MTKIKEFFSKLGAAIATAFVAILGVLLYLLKAKQKEINALKAKIDLVETQKQADLLEIDIKQRLQNKDLLQKEIDELNKSLILLEDKRKQLAEHEKNRQSTQEVEDFWNKNQ